MKKALFLLSVAVLCSTQVFGWGQKGHDIAAYVAEQHLSKKVAQKVTSVLEGHSLVYYANWLDNASHTPKYAYTSTWHYANVDEGYTYETMPRNEKGDVVGAVKSIVTQLCSGELTAEQENEAVRMLIHLVGDMHCPMHAGRKSDVGGNRGQIKFFNKNTNLHRVWDSQILESAHAWSYTEWQQQIDRLSQEEIDEICKGTVEDWFGETVAEAQKIYEEIPEGKNLSYNEVAYYAPVVERQLLKAGVRLAFLLEEIYK